MTGKRQNNKSGVDLTKAYQTATIQIIQNIEQLKPASVNDLQLALHKVLNQVIFEFDKLNQQAISKASIKGVLDGQTRMSEYLNKIFNGRSFTDKDLKNPLLDEKNKLIAKSTLEDKERKNIANSVFRQNYLDVRSNLMGMHITADKEVKETIFQLAKDGKNTVLNVQKTLADKYRAEGVLNVTFSNGSKVKVDAYTNMIVRTARTESNQHYNEQIASKLGTSLVKCFSNAITCPVCGVYRDRVFCVDGKDIRFPSLRGGGNAPLKHGYNTIHPNCRCEFLPYFEELQTAEELAKDIAFSNRPFEDSRTRQQQKDYQEWQATNRQIRDEINEFNYMSGKLGDKMPYSTIGGCRRAARQDELPTNIKKLRYEKRDEGQYERWENILGSENVPDTLDKFQEMKYNNVKEFEELKSRKENAYLDMSFEAVKEKLGLLPNDKARRWYNVNVHKIAGQIDKTKALSEQAQQACDLRNMYRSQTRELMSNDLDRIKLDKERPNVTFEQLVKDKMNKYEVDKNSAYEKIIESACRTNRIVNNKFGI